MSTRASEPEWWRLAGRLAPRVKVALARSAQLFTLRSRKPSGTIGDVTGEKDAVRLTAWVSGRVQGVGFRWWTRCRARELGLVGSARNLDDGRVRVVAEGTQSHCQQLLDTLRSTSSPGRVDQVVEHWSPARGGLVGFFEE